MSSFDILVTQDAREVTYSRCNQKTVLSQIDF